MSTPARCGRSDQHGPHVIDRGEDGNIHAWCMGTQDSRPEWVRRAQARRLPAKDTTGQAY